MGYGQKAKGTIRITPPVGAAELRTLADLTNEFESPRSRRSREAVLIIRRNVTPTEDGEVVQLFSYEIGLVGPESSFSRYDALENIQEIIDNLPDHEFSGHILLDGEDGGKSAYVVTGRTVEEIYPKIVWPWGEAES